jgi:pyridoxamine 5'-phosphate oxidase
MTDLLWHHRQPYDGAPLDVDTVDPDPIAQFRAWFAAAEASGMPDVNGMTLATVDPDGRPSARIVLLKEVDERGFVFYTNYESRKGRAMEAHPFASLVFWWIPLHRQVRIDGRVERVSSAESDAYFAARPRASNLSAIASPQSQQVADRASLEAAVAATAARFADGELSRPETWGGYRVVPDALELWQGRPDRLHDRIRYSRIAEATSPAGAGWQRVRLAP